MSGELMSGVFEATGSSVETNKPEISAETAETSAYDPDKRIETVGQSDVPSGEEYDPDKRIEPFISENGGSSDIYGYDPDVRLAFDNADDELSSKEAEVSEETDDTEQGSEDQDTFDDADGDKQEEEKEASDTDVSNESKETNAPIENKIAGMERENQVKKELEEKYPADEGYEIVSEAYLRDGSGKIIKDSETGEARRVDFVVVKDGKVVDSIEVTSKTADKTEQSAKENRIRNAGGNYIKDSNGNLCRIPDNVRTRIERRD